MTDSEHQELRDLLPDHVGGVLDASTSAAVASHLGECAECAREAELLRLVLAARPIAPALDVAAIVAALPRPAAAARAGVAAAVPPKLTLISNPPSVVRQPARPRRLPAFTSGVWKAAATLVILLGGSWSVFRVQHPGESASPISAGPDSGEISGIASNPSGASSSALSPTASPSAGDSAPGAAASAARTAAISVGDLSGYTDEELKGMLSRLEKWDGAAAVDPLPTAPLLDVGRQGALE